MAACRAAGFGWAVVMGEPAYYARFGFRPASGFGLCDEYGGGSAFQVIELLPGALPSGAGLVRYAPEFASLGGGPAPNHTLHLTAAASRFSRVQRLTRGGGR